MHACMSPRLYDEHYFLGTSHLITGVRDPRADTTATQDSDLDRSSRKVLKGGLLDAASAAGTTLLFLPRAQGTPLSFLHPASSCFCCNSCSREGTTTIISGHVKPLARPAVPTDRGRLPPVKVSAQHRGVRAYRLRKDDPHGTHLILYWADTRYP